MSSKKLVTPKTMSDILGVTQQTLRRYTSCGCPHTRTFGGDRRFIPCEVLAWLDKQKQKRNKN